MFLEMHGLQKERKKEPKDRCTFCYILNLTYLCYRHSEIGGQVMMGDTVLSGDDRGFTICLPKHGNHAVTGFVQEYLFLSFEFILVMLNREVICPFFLDARVSLYQHSPSLRLGLLTLQSLSACHIPCSFS